MLGCKQGMSSKDCKAVSSKPQYLKLDECLCHSGCKMQGSYLMLCSACGLLWLRGVPSCVSLKRTLTLSFAFAGHLCTDS